MCILSLLLILCSIFYNCSHFSRNDTKENTGISDSLLLDSVNNLGVRLRKDSIYTDLILKIKKDSTYIPIISYIVDNIIPEYYAQEYCRVEDETFFNEPLDYLKKISIKDRTLVIAEFDMIRQRYYFLLNKECQITDHMEFTSYRECINQRQIYDWNRDGNLDIVEQREYCGQLFSSTTQVVYSTINGMFERIFSLETQELNIVTLDEHGCGSMVRRIYKQKRPGVFRITEIRGRIDGYANTNRFLSIDNSKHYEMTAQELLGKFGTQYEKYSNND